MRSNNSFIIQTYHYPCLFIRVPRTSDNLQFADDDTASESVEQMLMYSGSVTSVDVYSAPVLVVFIHRQAIQLQFPPTAVPHSPFVVEYS